MYVLDTGIRSTHDEFRFPAPDGSPAPIKGSRVGSGYDAVYDTNNLEDCHGHGTHVSAIFANLKM